MFDNFQNSGMISETLESDWVWAESKLIRPRNRISAHEDSRIIWRHR